MTYEEAIQELEAILQDLQNAPTKIDELHANIARAESLIAACRAKLRGAEDALDELRRTSEG